MSPTPDREGARPVRPRHGGAEVAACYASLDALLDAFAAGDVPERPHGGFISVHPAVVEREGPVMCDVLCERAARFSLRVLVTSRAPATQLRMVRFVSRRRGREWGR